jgi:DNA-binding NarL/FixJ family response regulator
MDSTSNFDPTPSGILLVECNAILRDGMRAWLQQEFPNQPVDAISLFELPGKLAAGSRPALALVDIDARYGEGFAALRSLRELRPEALLIALSLYPVDYFRESAMKAGAVGCACIALADDRLRDLLRELLPSLRERMP